MPRRRRDHANSAAKATAGGFCSQLCLFFDPNKDRYRDSSQRAGGPFRPAVPVFVCAAMWLIPAIIVLVSYEDAKLTRSFFRGPVAANMTKKSINQGRDYFTPEWNLDYVALTEPDGDGLPHSGVVRGAETEEEKEARDELALKGEVGKTLDAYYDLRDYGALLWEPPSETTLNIQLGVFLGCFAAAGLCCCGCCCILIFQTRKRMNAEVTTSSSNTSESSESSSTYSLPGHLNHTPDSSDSADSVSPAHRRTREDGDGDGDVTKDDDAVLGDDAMGAPPQYSSSSVSSSS
jgi:hypothetical protein